MSLSVTLWSADLSHPISSLENWAEIVERNILAGREKGASVFLMPEYVCEHWLRYASTPIAPQEEIAWMAGNVAKALSLLQGLSQKHDMLIVAGSFACATPDSTPSFCNRAHIIFPDGAILTQDKLCLTPQEKNLAGWNVSPGDSVTTFMWRGCKIAVLICLDIELPALSAKIAGQEIDLILVPSMTDTLAGYHRVFGCAKARAVELQAAVAVCGTIGTTSGGSKNVSGAAFFLPCEEKYTPTGVLSALPPTYKTEGDGLLLTADIPLEILRKLRGGKAEVWPGAFSAAGIRILHKP